MKINIGLVGCGVVGTGVINLLEKHNEMLKMRSGADITIKKVAVANIDKPRNVNLDKSIFTNNVDDILNDDEIDIIIELVGGTTFAYDLIKKALEKNKHIITANKALLYEYGEEIFEIASKYKKEIRFEGSVAGGIPIIKVITESLAGNKISSIYGIVNGTTNYILTKMIDEEWSFEEALSKAQELGFAESDPTMDISGGDAKHKLTIMASVAFNSTVNKDNVYCEGIENINLKDVLYAKELGYVIKLLAIVKNYDDVMELRVHPTLLPEKSGLASVSNEFNAVMINSDFLGNSQYIGKGAGANPTASSVVGDLTDLSIVIRNKKEYNEYLYKPFNNYKTISYMEVVSRFYLRITAIDKAGTLGIITKILGDYDISITAIIQKEVKMIDQPVPIVIITHKAVEKNVREAVEKIDALDISKEKTIVMHIEDLED